MSLLSPMPSRIADRTDLGDIVSRFRDRRRAQIPNFLEPEFAYRLHGRLVSWSEWALVTRIDGRHRIFDANGMDQLELEKRATFDELVAAEARAGFQYLYERFPLYDRGRSGQLADPVLTEVYALLRSEAFLEMGRQLTGDPGISYANGQVSRYRRGHFLTLHDDGGAEGVDRVAAYVLNMTPDWPADYGGQLQFADDQGRAEETVTPRINSLSVFAVPCPHLVSAVAPFVSGSRFAITGWFNRGEEPTVRGNPDGR